QARDPGRLDPMPMSPSTAAAWQSLSVNLKKLRTTWPMGGWSWDTRMGCVTSSFSTQYEAEARASAAQGLPLEWTQVTLAKAPARLRDLAERTGGVRSGQLVLTGGPLDGMFAYGLWWPWGNGHTISLRIGLADIEPEREPYPQFRDLFGVET